MKSARTRRIPMMTTSATATIEGTKPPDVIVRGNASGFLQEIVSGAHQLRADEPSVWLAVSRRPDDYLLVGLGACTSNQ